MPIFIEMPKLSDTMTEGTLVKWLKSEGDTIEIGDEVAEIETDKATMAMEGFDEGVLYKILVSEGSKIALGGKLAVILEEGEEAPSESELREAIATTPSGGIVATEVPVDAENGLEASVEVVSDPILASNERVKASPLARKIAAEKGLSLASVQGTGPGGRIVRKDVETMVSSGSTVVKAAPVQASPPAVLATIRASAGAEDRRIPLSSMRTIIAERLIASKTQIPHFYLNIEVDAAPLMALRSQVNEASARSDGNKYTVNDFVLKAIVGAIADEPRVNASFDGDAIIQFASVQLSVAIAVDDGLLTPVIRGAESKSLMELSLAVKDLAERARNKKLAPDEFQGGTVTVSNLGAYGIDSFDAIINPPQAIILSIGAIKKLPVVNDAGAIVSGLRMWVGMSCDHRVVDGAVGATYLQALKKLIENPALMLV